MSSEVDLVGNISLSGGIDFFPGRKAQERQAHAAGQSALSAISPVTAVSEMSDEALVQSLPSDPQTLGVLFQRHSRLVYSIALRIIRDTGEAEEVVQECFLYVYRKAMTFEPSRGSAKGWIVQIAYSRARDRKAQLSRRGFYLRTDIEAPELEDTLIGRGDTEREVEARLDFSNLQCAFDNLTLTQQETLKLFYFEGMELREISERLHEPLGNVRHYFYRGLERLRRSMLAERVRNHHNGKN